MDHPLEEVKREPEIKPEPGEELSKPMEDKVEKIEKEEKKTETKAKNQAPKWLIWTSIIQIVLLVFIALQISDLDLPTAAVVADQPTPTQPSAPTPTINMAELLDDDAVKGEADAPVTIVEFSDFECPFCARFYSQTYSQIKSEYIDTGKVKLIYRDFPLNFHPNAQKAAEAAECAGEQGKYYQMHDKLFEDGMGRGVLTFKQYAQEIGLDTTVFNTCLDSGEMASEVRKDFLGGQKVEIRGTPGSFVLTEKDNTNIETLKSMEQIDPRTGNYIIKYVEAKDNQHVGLRISGALPFSVFQQIIEAELG